MEVVRGWTHRAFPIDDASRIGEARRYAAQCVADMEWNEVDAGRLALVITELGTNLQRHARKGRLLVAARPHSAEMEVVAIDEGPGMPDVELAMRDGHSSGSTPGTGLGAIRRLADDFDIHSAVPDGTVSVARVRAAPARPASDAGAAPMLEVGALCLPAPGESVCGDGWAVATDGECTTVLMADGLGHGPEAARASQAAIEAFAASPVNDLVEAVQRIHQALKGTRGAAMCVLTIDTGVPGVSYAGAGNIAGRVLSGVFDKSIVTQHGTAGLQIRRPEATRMELPAHALVILHSDGLETRWTVERIRPLLQRDLSLVAAVLLREHTRHRDDATVVVLRRKE